MKKSVLLLSGMLFTASAFAQDEITICHTPAIEKFALFASNKSFK